MTETLPGAQRSVCRRGMGRLYSGTGHVTRMAAGVERRSRRAGAASWHESGMQSGTFSHPLATDRAAELSGPASLRRVEATRA